MSLCGDIKSASKPLSSLPKDTQCLKLPTYSMKAEDLETTEDQVT